MNLNAFQQSHFLQSLGWAIANNVWQAGICWALYYIIISSYASASSKVKNNIGTIFLFGTFFWFVTTFFDKFIYLQNNIREAIPGPLIFSTDVYSAPRFFSLQNFSHAVGITLPYLSVGYLLLLLIFTAKLINSYRNTIFIRYNGLQKPGVEWRLFVEKVAGHMDITKEIKLWFSKHVDVPATIGFLKPVILIPVASLNQLTEDQLEAIILHELSHIKRNDYLINLFISLIETILFFNPFVVLLSKIIKKERENCCDDFVLQYQYDRHSYASALLSLEKYRIQNLHLALTATSDKKQLLFRIKRIMEVKNNNDSLNYGQKLMALLLTTAIIFSIAWLSPAKKSNRLPNSKQLSKNLVHTTHEINKENHIFLRSKDQITISSIVPPQIIKDKSIKLINVPVKINSPKKMEEDAFTWKMKDAEIVNNLGLLDSYNSNAVMPPTLYRPTPEFIGADNLFFLPKMSPPDIKFFQNLNVEITTSLSEIEKSNHSLSSINWEIVPQEIFESLKKIKISQLKITTKKNKIDPIIDKVKRDKNTQKEFQFSLITDDGNNNIPTWNITAGFRDFLFAKDINSSNDDSDRIFFETYGNDSPMPSPPPEKRNRTIKISSHGLNPSSPIYSKEDNVATNVYLTHREKKLPLKQSIQIDYKNGAVFINGEKIHAADLKTYQAQAIVEKLLFYSNKQIIDKQTENL